ncbi:MAG TPA: hypothetical protein VMT64_10195 [Candidatus Binataceae bacterium]|nr:hypothetical protein [Candidatus Binataceae bacterium]
MEIEQSAVFRMHGLKPVAHLLELSALSRGRAATIGNVGSDRVLENGPQQPLFSFGSRRAAPDRIVVLRGKDRAGEVFVSELDLAVHFDALLPRFFDVLDALAVFESQGTLSTARAIENSLALAMLRAGIWGICATPVALAPD